MHDANHTVGDWLIYIQDYLTEAFHRASREEGYQGALDTLRKVAAMCVACFEQNGVPSRQIQSDQTNARDGQRA